jgi:hypothetical protein
VNVRVSREQVISCLRDHHWKFEDATKRVEIYRKKGSPQRIDVPKRDSFPLDFVRIILRQAGVSQANIDAFLCAAVKSTEEPPE